MCSMLLLLGDVCYNFNTTGRCSRGVTCRFGSGHMTPDGYNKIDMDKYEEFKTKKPSTINSLTYDLLISLRKRTYDFSLTQNTIANDDERRKRAQEEKNKSTEIDGEKEETSVEEIVDNMEEKNIKTSGTVTDEDVIKLRQCEKKTIDWKDKLYLSPLTTVGNLPFRYNTKYKHIFIVTLLL